MKLLILIAFLGSLLLAAIFGTLSIVQRKDSRKLKRNLIITALSAIAFVAIFFGLAPIREKARGQLRLVRLQKLNRQRSSRHKMMMTVTKTLIAMTLMMKNHQAQKHSTQLTTTLGSLMNSWHGLQTTTRARTSL